jgi:hypothetical protein
MSSSRTKIYNLGIGIRPPHRFPDTGHLPKAAHGPKRHSANSSFQHAYAVSCLKVPWWSLLFAPAQKVGRASKTSGSVLHQHRLYEWFSFRSVSTLWLSADPETACCVTVRPAAKWSHVSAVTPSSRSATLRTFPLAVRGNTSTTR